MLSLFLLPLLSLALDNGLGLVPAMGWRPYDSQNCITNQSFIHYIADQLVSSGMAQKGYSYVVLDKCWQVGRDDSTGVLVENREKYPSGMKGLADYLHSKGLKLGITSGASYFTCDSMPGIKKNEKLDTKTFVQWGIDLVSFDYCPINETLYDMKWQFYQIQKAFNESGRHIMIMIDFAGTTYEKTYEWAGPFANSWKVGNGVKDLWKSVTTMVDKSLNLEFYGGPGGYNDLGTLLVGKSKMKQHEYRTQFYLWSILKSPLFVGFTDFTEEVLELLLNDDFLQINQDRLGIQAQRVQKEQRDEGTIEVWGANLTNNHYAVLLFNRGQLPITIEVQIREELKLEYVSYRVRDAVHNEDLGEFNMDVLSEEIEGHHASVYVLELKFGQEEVYDL